MLSFLEIKSSTGRKTEDDQPVEDFIEEVKITFEAREMASAERVDFITSHLEGPEARMYSKKDRSNPDFLQDVLTQSFGEKRSSSQLLKLFEQKEREKLRAYSHSLNELLKNATKADPKAVSDLEKTLRDQFEDNVRDPFLRKEQKRFIWECNPSFLDLREGALC